MIEFKLKGDEVWYEGYVVAVLTDDPPATIREEIREIMLNVGDLAETQEALAEEKVSLQEQQDSFKELEEDVKGLKSEVEALKRQLARIILIAEDLD